MMVERLGGVLREMKTKIKGPIWERTELGRTLVWHGKYSSEYWNADTPERFKAAALAMFEILDSDSCYYELSGEDDFDLDELAKLEKKVALLSSDPELVDEKDKARIAYLKGQVQETSRDKLLYEQAKKGEWKAAWNLISSRQDYEYEDWEFIHILDPLTK